MPTHFHSYIVFSFQNVHPDKEILVDVVMCLWQKCKTELRQIQMSGSDCLEYIHKHQAYQVLLQYNVFLLMWMQSVKGSEILVSSLNTFSYGKMQINLLQKYELYFEHTVITHASSKIFS